MTRRARPETAALQLLDASIADYATIEQDDLAWAKPYVDEAVEQVERGEVLSLEEYDARIDALMAKLTANDARRRFGSRQRRSCLILQYLTPKLGRASRSIGERAPYVS